MSVAKFIIIPLIILQWNAQSLLAHGHELKNYINQTPHQPDIICIQESWLKPSLTFKIAGYELIRKDRTNGIKGGVCIFIKECLTYKNIFHPDKNDIEYIHIAININQTSINIINIYNPCKKIYKNQYSSFFSHNNVIICGDFNSKNQLWGSNYKDCNGKILQELIEDNDISILNDGHGSFLLKNGYKSCLDLTFTSPKYASCTSWTVLENNLGSDHFPIETKIYNIKNTNEIYHHEKWNYRKAKWQIFQNEMEKIHAKRPQILDTNINDYNTMLNNDIIEKANLFIPKCKSKHKNPVPYWNEECNLAIKERNKAKRKVIRTKLPQDWIEYKKQKAITQKVIKQAKKLYWQQYCNNLNKNTNLNQIWKTVKKLKNGQNSNSSSIPTIVENGKEYITDEQKAEAFAKTYELTSNNQNYDISFLQRKDKFLKTNISITYNALPTDHVLDEKFNSRELQYVLQSTKNTAPGRDNITYEMIKHFSQYSLDYLLNYYNHIWNTGIIPDQWKTSIIIPILKKDKNKETTTSYRPISLTSNIGKIMEKLVTVRLNWYMEKNELFNKYQSGFRNNRNTYEHLFRLQNDILNSINNKSKTIAVFLDINKAYDMLWREGLLYKLQQLHINGKMYNWIRNFLNNRKFQVKINSKFSKLYDLQNGTPQGSCISPILFIIMINDLNINTPNVQISIFADDIAIWITGHDLNYITSQIQKALIEIENWMDKWGFKLSINKSKAIIFNNTEIKKFPVKLKVHNEEIEYVSKFKFLGLIFDNKLSWIHHINYIEESCNKRINLLRCISGTNWGANRKNLYNLYTAIIRSKIDYGSEFYYTANKKNLSKLDQIQYKSLRICNAAMKSTPIQTLLVMNNEMPLNIRRNTLQTKFLYKVFNKEIFKVHTNIYMQNFHANKNPKKQNMLNLLSTTYSYSRNTLTNYHNHYNIQTKPLIIPFWQIPEIKINLELYQKVNKLFSPNLTKIIALEHINKFSDFLQIYTDGSKQTDKRTASAVYIPELDIEISKRIPDECSVYSSELTAIILALKWINEIKPSNIVLFTDSLSSLISLQNIRNHIYKNTLFKELSYLFFELFNNDTNIILTWIPSHINLTNHDKVDQLAKNATKNNNIQLQIPLNQHEINSDIQLKFNSEWKTIYNNNNKGRFFRTVEPHFDQIQPIHFQNRHMEKTIFRLKTGHCRLNSHLHKIGLHDSGLCDFCEELETVKHFILECLEFQQYQEDIIHFAHKHNIKITIENVLSNKSFYPIIYEYVLKTKKNI
jgi:ribonuclease HI